MPDFSKIELWTGLHTQPSSRCQEKPSCQQNIIQLMLGAVKKSSRLAGKEQKQLENVSVWRRTQENQLRS